LEIGVMGEKY